MQFSYITSGNVKWNKYFRKRIGSLLNINICLPHDPDILFLGNYPREMKAYVHIKSVHEFSLPLCNSSKLETAQMSISKRMDK